MKLVPWMCLLIAANCTQVFADDTFSAYRLGDYKKAAEALLSNDKQDAIANYYLGRMYLYGYGQLKNNDTAMRYFLKAADQGYLPAVQLMAKYTLFKDKNPEQTINWFKKAAAKGEVNAQMFLAASYLYGYGVKKNTDMATRYYIDAAKNGNAIAQFALAENFIDSKNSSNNKLGLIWLNKAVQNGNPRAQAKLGYLYLVGKGVAPDVEKGKELLLKAVDRNNTTAMITLGDLALANKEYENAIKWYKQAIGLKDPVAELRLAHAYLQDKSPIYDANSGFLWTLKAAQNGLTEAKNELANLYQKGIGVTADPNLANEWIAHAKQKDTKPVLEEIALWLSNQLTDQLEQTPYQLKGIFSAWHNTAMLRNNIYNQSPQLAVIAQQDIFKPNFEMIQPNDIPITHYYDALLSQIEEVPSNQWTYPNYQLSPQMEALKKVTSLVLNRINLPAPYMEANYYDSDDFSQANIMDIWTPDWQEKVNYMALFNQMYAKAILGDTQSQFQIGQMFEQGLGVEPNPESAIVFYQNAAEQQHLGAIYQLGILHLTRAKDEAEYQSALNWLTEGAFKGNRKCQYVLARLLTEGVKDKEGHEYIKSNPEQGMAMLYLSAANNYGLAEFELGQHLAKQSSTNLSQDLRKQHYLLIRQLYEGAVANGVAQAVLPLAYYNAMDADPQRQKQAFEVAEAQAQTGDESAALLLGMLYDRGIGVSADANKAITWYQRSGANFANQFILGTYLAEGKNIEKDLEKGRAFLQNSSKNKFSDADFNLAMLQHQQGQEFLPNLIQSYALGNSHAGVVLADYYLSQNNNAGGTDVQKLQEAKKIYENLADKGDEQAQLKLAYMFEKGVGGAPDFAAAERNYIAAANQGNVWAQYLLGQFYQLGQLGQVDEQLAKEWYQKAATKLPKAWVALGFIDETVYDDYAHALEAYETAVAQKDPLGYYNLALMYEYGKGVPVNFSKAQALFLEAANQGSNEAMNQLGNMNFYGLGQDRNESEALYWYKKAAALNNDHALYTLGLLSETGVATKIDFTNALNFYKQAANLGNERALLALARMYNYGLGVAKDQKTAADLYQKLADKQNAYAQYQLGTYYLEGTLGERLPEKAKLWLKKASDNGSIQASKILQRLEAQTQGQVSFIEPVMLNKARVLSSLPADLMFFDALNEWNRGDELLSRMILQRCVTQYPNFAPAKQIYEKLS